MRRIAAFPQKVRPSHWEFMIATSDSFESNSSDALPDSKKVYVPGKLHPGLRVAFRLFTLRTTRVKNGQSDPNVPVRVYVAARTWGDASFFGNVQQGLPALRRDWVVQRGDVEESNGHAAAHRKNGHSHTPTAARLPLRAKAGKIVTQLRYARQGVITPEMEFIAIRENMGRHESVGNGYLGRQLVHNNSLWSFDTRRNHAGICPRRSSSRARRIPCNINHPELEPMIIGRNFLVKINANIGNSAIASSIEEEVENALGDQSGAPDTVMDLSAGEIFMRRGSGFLRNSPVPIGTVPIYQALEKVGGKAEDLTWEIYRDTLLEQCEQGVDYFTIHAGDAHLPFIPMTARRALPPSSAAAVPFWPSGVWRIVRRISATRIGMKYAKS